MNDIIWRCLDTWPDADPKSVRIAEPDPLVASSFLSLDHLDALALDASDEIVELIFEAMKNQPLEPLTSPLEYASPNMLACARPQSKAFAPPRNTKTERAVKAFSLCQRGNCEVEFTDGVDAQAIIATC
nr:hypothetical protein [Achromobacter xylosoxidans]